MAQKSYRDAPTATNTMPSGIPYIVANEAAERFSYYGMKAILVVFMTQHLLGSQGSVDPMSEGDAKSYFHLFTSAVYFFPIIGALIADVFFGKYKTILILSVVYCFGHLALAMDETRFGLLLGLGLIAVGSGGIKPCVSAHVGDQFGSSNKHLLDRVYSWFYFAINFGSFFSTLMTPVLLHHYGAWAAFGLPGVLMLIATVLFWMGRHRFIHIPAGGMGFVREVFSREGLGAIAKLLVIYVFVAMFWALFDQTGSSWVLQAQNMDRNFLGVEWHSSQVQALNPILVLILIPVFSYVIYPAINKVFPLTALRKISIGFFVAALSFVVVALAESQISAGHTPSIAWQLVAYLVLTAAEVMVSITCLEFSYTQAPKKMKSLVMAVFLLSVSIGNIFTSGVNFVIQNDDGSSKLDGASYYWFFVACMLATALAFIAVAKRYKEKTYIQDEQPENTARSGGATLRAEPVS